MQSPVSIGLFASSIASLNVPLRIASTVFLVDPVSFAICELLNSSGYLLISQKIAYGFSCLNDNGVYFEFVPFTSDSITEDGAINPNAKALSIEEVEEGVDYILIISTVSGAWRYMIGDTVAFTNKELAEIKITGRTKFFLNVVGSQLSVNKMDDAISAINEEFEINIKEFTVAAVREGDDYIHHWYLGAENDSTNVDHKKLTHFLDDHLKDSNKNYKVARNKALKDIKVDVVPVQTFLDWNDANKKKGGQVKMAKVMKEEAFREWQEFVTNNN